MNLDAIVTQLRAYAPIFNTNVAGAAQFDEAVSGQTWMPAPAAYVVPMPQEATENLSRTGLKQVITDRIGVCVLIDSSADRRGQAAAGQVITIRAAIFAALLNWHIDPTRSTQGMYFGGARAMDFDRARLFWQFDFCLDEQFTDADGFQLPPGVPLVEFDKTYKTPAGKTLAVQHVLTPHS